MSKAIVITILWAVLIFAVVGHVSNRHTNERSYKTVGAAFEPSKSQEIKGFRVISERVYVPAIKAFVTEIEVDGRKLFFISDINQYSSFAIERAPLSK